MAVISAGEEGVVIPAAFGAALVAVTRVAVAAKEGMPSDAYGTVTQLYEGEMPLVEFVAASGKPKEAVVASVKSMEIFYAAVKSSSAVRL